MKLVFVVLLIIGISLQYKKEKTILLDRFDVCKLGPDSPFSFGEQRITTINHTSYLRGWFDLSKDVERVSIILKLTRCSNKFALDSCEKFSRLPTRDSCSFLRSSRTMISSLTHNARPQFVCPFKKGHYEISNGTLDPNLEMFPLDNWYWKILADVHDAKTNKHLFTMCIEGQVVPLIT